MSEFNALASSISASVDGDEFVDTLTSCKDDVEHFLSECGEPTEAAPINPNPTPTDAEAKAWKDAWTLKSFAGQATEHHTKQIAHRIRKGKRKNGQKINEPEAEKLAQSVVETAKGKDMSTLSAAVLDSRQS